MNCRDFENVVGDLADQRPLDASAREAGLGHAALCADCAALLTEARGVGAALRVASRAEQTDAAPARVKQALLAAFAERQPEAAAHSEDESNSKAAANSTAARGATVVGLSSRRAPRRWWGAIAAAAAAVVLLALGLTYLRRGAAVESQTPPSPTTAALPSPAPPAKGGEAAQEDRAEKSEAAHATATAARDDSSKRTPLAARGGARVRRAGVGVGSEAVARGAGNDFVPLTYFADATAIESGTVVRVELSRSSLLSLGVPLNIERGDELLKADVVLGDDGVARAIRLVE